MYADDERMRAAREGVMSRIPLARFAEPEDFVGCPAERCVKASSPARSSTWTVDTPRVEAGVTSALLVIPRPGSSKPRLSCGRIELAAPSSGHTSSAYASPWCHPSLIPVALSSTLAKRSPRR